MSNDESSDIRECFYCRWWHNEDLTCRIEYPYTVHDGDDCCEYFDETEGETDIMPPKSEDNP